MNLRPVKENDCAKMLRLYCIICTKASLARDMFADIGDKPGTYYCSAQCAMSQCKQTPQKVELYENEKG